MLREANCTGNHEREARAGTYDLEVFVPFTTVRNTQRSIERAQWLCLGLDACIHIVRVLGVPYPLDLDRPAVDEAMIDAEMQELRSDLPVTVTVWFCREQLDGFLRALPTSALVIIGYEKRVLKKTREEKLARSLKSAGYRVSAFLEEKEHV